MAFTGIPPEAIRLFARIVGVSRAGARTEEAKLDYAIREILKGEADPIPHVRVGPGDDALVLDGDPPLVASTDMSVEGAMAILYLIRHPDVRVQFKVFIYPGGASLRGTDGDKIRFCVSV